MFGDKHSTDGSSLDCSEKKAGKSQRQKLIEIVPVNCWHCQWRQSLRHIAEKFHATRLEGKCRGSDNGANDDKKSDRFVFQKNLSQNEHCQADYADEKRS